MTEYSDIKVHIDIEFGLSLSEYMSARLVGGLNARPFKMAIASCLYLSLMNQEAPTDDTVVSKTEVQNGIKLFNAVTKSTVSTIF